MSNLEARPSSEEDSIPQTKKLPFTFSEEIYSFDKSFTRLLGKVVENEQLQFISIENIQGYSHGINWQSHYASDPNEVSVMQKHSHEISIKFEDVINNEISVIRQTLQSLVQQMTSTFMRIMYEAVHESTEKTGNVVSAVGSGSYSAAFLEMLEKIEFGVDRDGNPTLPEIHAPPGVAEKIFAELSSQGPEFETKVEQIKKQKMHAAIEREEARRSKFVRDS